jgi:exonuclease III
MGSLKGLFWNSDGFGDIAKHLFVKEQLREEKLDFIALLETGRSNFSVPFLKNLANGLDFSWFCLPPHGRSRGILVGINNTSLQVGTVQAGDFCVKLHVRCKHDGFEWVLVPVYGAAQDAHKAEFLAKLARMGDTGSTPSLIGGDFNILRRREDKNNDSYKPHWSFVFNAIIESLNLRESSLREVIHMG